MAELSDYQNQGSSKHMTPEEKIAALVEHVKTEFPDGCKGVDCIGCPLKGFPDFTIEKALCKILSYRIPYANN